MTTDFAYFARQPILDVDKNLYGYEILFRSSDKNVFPDICSETATQRLIGESLLLQNIEDLTGGKRCFVNFPRVSLLQELPALLPKNQLVVEVLEDVEPDEELLVALRSLHQQGYTIALDDYCHDPRWEQFADIVGIIKFDLMAQSWEELAGYVESFKQYDIRLLAEKVETLEDFSRAKALGFTLYQGYFFSKPEMVERRTLDANELIVIQLLQAVNREYLDFEHIEKLFSSDLSLSYKLLRIVNSKIGHRGVSVDSIGHAAVYLGSLELRKFTALVATQSTSGRAPHAASHQAISRALFCESVAKSQSVASSTDGFMTGLFSLLDAIMALPMEQLLENMPLPTAVRAALCLEPGDLGDILVLSEALERAEWPQVEKLCAVFSLAEDKCFELYRQALQEADAAMVGLFGSSS